MPYTRDFSYLGKQDVGLAGGKGASLGEMTQAGIPVPPGFVVLAAAFDRFLQQTELHARIETTLDDVDYSDVASVEHASTQIRALVEGAVCPPEIEREITQSFVRLGSTFVAVRSSATAEDSSSASWAGELESYLNTTQATLLDRVKKCWASLFTPRAITYRQEKGLRTTKVAVAVVVQKMVQSEVSGVCFTVHPVTRDPRQLLIEACWGLGEYIVGGIVTPDSYVVDARDGTLLDVTVADQAVQLVRGPTANEEQPVSQEMRSRQKLDTKQVRKLADICLRIEKHYGFPCDIEWAFEHGVFFIVQSRPITTL